MKKFKTINFNQIFIIFILIQPVLDVLTSLFIRNISSSLTVGIFVRLIFMAITVIYSLVSTNKKYKIKLLIYYILLAIYTIFYSIICYSNTGTTMILVEIKGLVKTLYLPIILSSLLTLYKSDKIKINTKYLIYALFGYSIVIVFAKYFNIGYHSYVFGDKSGTVGLFFAANEIGSILAILSPFLLISYKYYKNNNFYILTYILLTFSVLELGTKVPFLAFILLLVLNILVKLYKTLILKDKKYIKDLSISFINIIFIILIIGITPIGKNLDLNFIEKFANRNQNVIISPSSETIENKVDTGTKHEPEDLPSVDYISGRGDLFKTNYEEYSNSKIIEQLLGTSYLTYDDNEIKEKKLVEMDFFDIFINHGIIGFTLILLPLILLTLYIIYKYIRNIKYIFKNPEQLIYIYAYFIGLAISFISGHVLTAPAVSIYVIISLILNIQLIETKE